MIQRNAPPVLDPEKLNRIKNGKGKYRIIPRDATVEGLLKPEPAELPAPAPGPAPTTRRHNGWFHKIRDVIITMEKRASRHAEIPPTERRERDKRDELDAQLLEGLET